MRHTIQRETGEYLHISGYIFGKSPHWTPDVRDSVVFATAEAAEQYIAKIGVKAKVVPRKYKEGKTRKSSLALA